MTKRPKVPDAPSLMDGASSSPNDTNSQTLIVLGRERKAPWVQVYVELLDEYAERIGGFAGIGLWTYLRGYVNRDPGNRWNGCAFPTTATLRKKGKVGGRHLRELLDKCFTWGLLDIEIVRNPKPTNGKITSSTRRFLYRVNDPLPKEEFLAAKDREELPRKDSPPRLARTPAHAKLQARSHPSLRGGTSSPELMHASSPELVTRLKLRSEFRVSTRTTSPDPDRVRAREREGSVPAPVVVEQGQSRTQPKPQTHSGGGGDFKALVAEICAQVPDLSKRTAEQFIRRYGAEAVEEHAAWLMVEIEHRRRHRLPEIEKPGGWLRKSFEEPFTQPPRSYRRRRRLQERQERAAAEAQAATLAAEAAATEEQRRRDEMRARVFVMAPERQQEIDAEARAAVASTQLGRAFTVPPFPEVLDSPSPGAVLWRVQVAERLLATQEPPSTATP